MSHIRHVAICVFHDRGRILAAGFDDAKKERFFRPLGGAVEFDELAADALRREIREELGLEIHNPVQLGVIENRFVYSGRPGHEIVFVFDASFANVLVYSQPTVMFQEPGRDGPAEWLDLSALSAPLYPVGLVELLRQAL